MGFVQQRLKAGEFMASYQENLTEGVMAAIEASPVAQALIEFMQGRQKWTGTAKQLLDAIAPVSIDPGSPPPRGWPVSGRGMSAVLTRFASALRRVGIHVEHLSRSDAKGSRRLRIAYGVPAQSSEPSDRQNPGQNPGGMRVPVSDGSNRSDNSIVRDRQKKTLMKSTLLTFLTVLTIPPVLSTHRATACRAATAIPKSARPASYERAH
jgi:hypothetical protein